MTLLPRLRKIFGILVLIVLGGTLGYHWIEGWSIFDGLYMVVITLGAVGYHEVHTLTNQGRAFTMLLIVAGVSLVTFTVGTLTRMVVEGEIQTLLGRRKAMSKIRNLRDHYIICGYGRIGSLMATEFGRRPIPFVVIERNDQTVQGLPQEFPVIQGDATEEDILIQAGIERAKGLATVLHSDADNLFVTLTARGLNPNLFILSRYEEPKSEMKLIRSKLDMIIVAIKKKSGHMEFNPSAASVLEEGDRLIAIGEREQLRRLEAMARREAG